VDAEGTKEYGVPPKTEDMIAGPGDGYSPEWYDSAPAPDAAAHKKTIAELPVNKWVKAPEGKRHRPHFAYSKVACDVERNQILVWAGGHATSHQSVVSRYSMATGTWHIDYPPQIGMSYGRRLWGKNYFYGYRPSMPRHPWAGYAYDPPSEKLVIARSSGPLMLWFNPDRGDFEQPEVLLPPGGGSQKATMAPTPDGALLWTGKTLYRFDHEKKEWEKLTIKGDKLPKTSFYDGIAYDSKRKNYVLFRGKNVYVYNPSDNMLKHMKAENRENAAGFVRTIKYIPEQDIFLHGTGEYWDPAKNRWGKLDFDCSVLKKLRKPKINTNTGTCWDPKRGVLWLVKGYMKQTYVLKPDFDKARRDNGSGTGQISGSGEN
jgi:hypothetical protein